MSSVACGSAAGFIVGTPGSTCGGGWWEVCCLSAGLIIRKHWEPIQLIKHLLHFPVGSVKIWLIIILSTVGLPVAMVLDWRHLQQRTQLVFVRGIAQVWESVQPHQTSLSSVKASVAFLGEMFSLFPGMIKGLSRGRSSRSPLKLDPSDRRDPFSRFFKAEGKPHAAISAPPPL